MKAENWFQLRIVGVAAIGVGQLDPERANINDCAVNGVLRRDNPRAPFQFEGTIDRVVFDVQ